MRFRASTNSMRPLTIMIYDLQYLQVLVIVIVECAESK